MTGVLTGWSAAVRLGRLTFRRVLRGKLLWISLVVAVLPLVILAFLGGELGPRDWDEVVTLFTMLLTIVPAMHVAPAVAEEIEDKTFTYLWSRPFPRWALLAGKLMALVPVVSLILLMAVAGAFFLTFADKAGASIDVLVHGLLATVAGVLSASAVSLGVGTALPRHATAAAIMYLLIIDTPVGTLPFAIQKLAVSYHIRAIALAPEREQVAPAGSFVWLLGIAAVWLVVAVWRVSVAEPATDK